MGIVDQESHPYHLGLRPLVYLPWLFGQIVIANWGVAKLVLGPKSEIRPSLVRVRASQKTTIGQVIFANSITLTPGTLSLDVRDGVILVHAIDEEAVDDVTNGEMDRRVSWLEGQEPGEQRRERED
jgi:multicomponent Na+:H+ antiporter subunit E